MRRPPASKIELQNAIDAVEIHGTVAEAARRLKIPAETLRDRVRAAGRKGMKPGQVDNTPTWQQERQNLLDTITDLRRDLRSTLRETITAKKIRAEILGLKEQPAKVPGWVINPSKLGSSGVPVLLIGDVHDGEEVDFSQMNGVNEYNMEIMETRSQRLIETTTSLCMHHVVEPNYPGIVVVFLGDMVSGTIHEELRNTNEAPMGPILHHSFGVWAWALQQLADVFGRVFVVGVVGNHGRNSARPISKGQVFDNWDWILYGFLEKHFSNDSRLKFHIPNNSDAHFSVAGMRFMATHGDKLGTRGGDGIIGCIGPIVRGDTKAQAQAESIDLGYDVLLIGHWHNRFNFPNIIVNSCIKGFCEYARTELRAKYQEPTQTLFFVHPKTGIYSYWPILLEGGRERFGATWVSWPDAK